MLNDLEKKFLFLQEFTNNNRKWTDDVFPEQGIIPTLLHLRREVNELIEAIETGQTEEYIMYEFADVYLILLNAISKKGCRLCDVHDYAVRKMNVNRSRDWQRLPDGSYHHL